MQNIPLTELHPFKDHPVQTRNNDTMRKLVLKIKDKVEVQPGVYHICSLKIVSFCIVPTILQNMPPTQNSQNLALHIVAQGFPGQAHPLTEMKGISSDQILSI